MGDKLIDILIGLVIGAYYYIFRNFRDTTNDRVAALEERPACKFENTNRRLIILEEKQDKLDPILTKILETLAGIKTDIEWIKKNDKN